MSTIVAGHFQLQEQVQSARNELRSVGFSNERISSFFLNPPGQHDITPIGGDRIASPGALESTKGALAGAAAGGALGAAIGFIIWIPAGAMAPVIGGLVGAHVGSLFSLAKMKEAGESELGGHGENRHEPRKPGMLVAVAARDPDEERRALEALRRLDSDHIERAEGTIENGDWTDFDPLSSPTLIR